MKQLELNFKREDGRTSRITVNNARDDLTGAEVKTVMDGIVAKDIFAPNGISLVAVEGATIVTTQEEELDLEQV